MSNGFSILFAEDKRCLMEMLRAFLKGEEGVTLIPQADEPEASPAYSAAVGLEEVVTGIIRDAGIPAHIKGYRFLRSAILLTVEDISVIGAVTKELYPRIARIHGTTPNRVERAIRHAIDVAWEKGRSGMRKPTNSEFIAMTADNIRVRQRNRQ